MKKSLLLLILILTLKAAQATIRRCNNNSTVTGTYLTAQAAHDAAAPGDTIHLEPSVQSYGDINITKRIVLISTGDFISQNPGYQASLTPGYCEQLTISSGGENSVISARCSYAIFIWTNNIVITHAHVSNIVIGYGGANTLTNIVISKCIIDNSISNNGPMSNIVISNNYINNLSLDNSSSSVVSNNVITSTNYMIVNQATLSNNIFIGPNYVYTFTNCLFSNNISSMNDLPAGSNNSNLVDLSTVFTNWGTLLGDNYQVLTSYTNQTVGMYAGADPYKRACTPGVPSIYQLIVPPTSSGANLNVTVSTRSNN